MSGSGLAGGEVLRGHLVEEVLALLDDLLGVLDVVLELDRRLGDDLLGGEDRRPRADGQREGVAGAGVDLQLAAVGLQRDGGEEGVLAQLGDRHLLAGDVELAEHVAQQVVGHRARRGGALELHEDRGGLGMADPDRQELVAVNGLEQDDRLLADHVEAHAVDHHLLHGEGLSTRGLPESSAGGGPLRGPAGGYRSACSVAQRASCERRRTPVLSRTRARCACTVRAEMKRRWLISSSVMPSATRRRTSSSRWPSWARERAGCVVPSENARSRCAVRVGETAAPPPWTVVTAAHSSSTSERLVM